MQCAPARLQQRPAERHFRRAEGNGRETSAAGIGEVGANMALPDDAGMAHAHLGEGEDRFRIAAAEGSGRLQVLQQAARRVRNGQAGI